MVNLHEVHPEVPEIAGIFRCSDKTISRSIRESGALWEKSEALTYNGDTNTFYVWRFPEVCLFPRGISCTVELQCPIV